MSNIHLYHTIIVCEGFTHHSIESVSTRNEESVQTRERVSSDRCPQLYAGGYVNIMSILFTKRATIRASEPFGIDTFMLQVRLKAPTITSEFTHGNLVN